MCSANSIALLAIAHCSAEAHWITWGTYRPTSSPPRKTCDQCCNKSSQWLGLESQFYTWLDSIFHLNDLTWLKSPVKWLTWLWLDRMLTQINEWLESWQMTRVITSDLSNDTHTHKVFKVNNVELWTLIVPSFKFRWENIKLILPSH